MEWTCRDCGFDNRQLIETLDGARVVIDGAPFVTTCEGCGTEACLSFHGRAAYLDEEMPEIVLEPVGRNDAGGTVIKVSGGLDIEEFIKELGRALKRGVR